MKPIGGKLDRLSFGSIISFVSYEINSPFWRELDMNHSIQEGTFLWQCYTKNEKNDLSGIEEKVISLYAHGMSTRDIHDQLKELYGSI